MSYPDTDRKDTKAPNGKSQKSKVFTVCEHSASLIYHALVKQLQKERDEALVQVKALREALNEIRDILAPTLAHKFTDIAGCLAERGFNIAEKALALAPLEARVCGEALAMVEALREAAIEMGNALGHEFKADMREGTTAYPGPLMDAADDLIAALALTPLDALEALEARVRQEEQERWADFVGSYESITDANANWLSRVIRADSDYDYEEADDD